LEKVRPETEAAAELFGDSEAVATAAIAPFTKWRREIPAWFGCASLFVRVCSVVVKTILPWVEI
jgi:hypothetical protein